MVRACSMATHFAMQWGTKLDWAKSTRYSPDGLAGLPTGWEPWHCTRKSVWGGGVGGGGSVPKDALGQGRGVRRCYEGVATGLTKGLQWLLSVINALEGHH